MDNTPFSDTGPQSAARATGGAERVVYVMPTDVVRPTEDDDFDFIGLWSILWGSRWLIVAITALFTVAAAAYAFFATQWYTAEVTLLPASSNSQQGGMSSQLGGLAGLASLTGLAGLSLGGANTTEPLAVLRSHDFTEKFIKKHDLLTTLLWRKWDRNAKQWRETDPKKIPDVRDAIRYFDEDVRRVHEDKKSGVVNVSIDWIDPVVATQWANLLIADLNDQMRERSLAEAETNLAYLKKELAAADVVTLQQSIGRLLEAELQKVMLARGKREFAFRVVDTGGVPKWRSSPKRIQLISVAVVAGFILAVFIAFLRHALRERRAADARGS